MEGDEQVQRTLGADRHLDGVVGIHQAVVQSRLCTIRVVRHAQPRAQPPLEGGVGGCHAV
eukprot:6117554-Pleurochrysis_carterae.AAC.1